MKLLNCIVEILFAILAMCLLFCFAIYDRTLGLVILVGLVGFGCMQIWRAQ